MTTTRLEGGGAGRRLAGRLTGERPKRGATPASLLALHDAGYLAVGARLGPGDVLDVGCGEGFETARFAGEGRRVLGVDVSLSALRAARAGWPGVSLACMDALALAVAGRSFDSVVSSHVIEHFERPSGHAAEVARALREHGTAYVLTPNAPADFENPFHLRLFGPGDLGELLGRHFREVWVGGVDAPAEVKAAFAARRAKAERLLRLDVLGLRHRIPRRWYVALYSLLLPLAYRLVGSSEEGATRSDGADWFVTESVDESTLVLFAVCRGPR